MRGERVDCTYDKEEERRKEGRGAGIQKLRA
jgi:hypothetical protein